MNNDTIRSELRRERTSIRPTLALGCVLVASVAVGIASGTRASAATPSVNVEQLSKNISDLQRRVAALEQRESGNGTYSDAATFCAATPASYNGNTIGGYPGAKAACVAACGNSPTAHMCVTPEIVRAQQTGLTLASGWVSSPDAQGADCAGWDNKVPVGPPYGPAYFSQYGFVTEDDCSIARPILCCD